MGNMQPEFTAADFSAGTAPYEYLWALNDNKFRQTQEKGRLDILARSLGVKNFLSIWKNYVELQMRQRKFDNENVTEFSGQEKELACGDYICDDTGVTLYTMSGWSGQKNTICSHPIMPVRRLINIDSGEVRVELAYKRGQVWRKAIFEKSQLASAQKIVGLSAYGIGVDSENARDLVKYLSYVENANYDVLPEGQSVGRLGWIGEQQFSPYVENVSFDGNLQYQHAFASVCEAGNWEAWRDLALQVRSGKSIVARVTLAASFASALIHPLEAMPFMVHMWGGTEAGKTVALMLAASVWASPSMGDYVKTFNSTLIGCEMQAAFCGSLPLCLDELQCIKNRDDFDDLIYMLCEGVGKSRGAKAGGLQKTLTWRNCTISTGEQPITRPSSGGGAVNRVIELDCKEEKLFPNPGEAVGIINKNYGHAGKKLIEMLVDPQTGEAMIQMGKAIQKAFQDELTGKATDKQALAASVLLAADAMTEILLFQDGKQLTVDDLLPYLSTKQGTDANLRAYEWLLDTIASNPNHFIPREDKSYQGECWGVVKDGQAFIVKAVFDRIMHDEGFNATAFLSWAIRSGHAIKKGNGHNTVLKRLPGSEVVARCVCLVLPAEDRGFVEVEDADDPFHGKNRTQRDEQTQFVTV